MLTRRDFEIIEFLDQYKVASTSTIQTFFFPSLSATRKRLKAMHEMNKIKRIRDNINNEYIYFTKRPKQMNHSASVTSAYSYLIKNYNLQKFKLEPSMGSIRPDALFGVVDNKNSFICCLEIELSNNVGKIKKYNTWIKSNEYKSYLPVTPMLLIYKNGLLSWYNFDSVCGEYKKYKEEECNI